MGIALYPKFKDAGTGQPLSWNGREAWLSDHIMDIVDYVALMSYCDSGNETIAQAEYEISLGNRLNKPVWVGSETLDVFAKDIGPKSITFAEEGVNYMEKQLAIIARRFMHEPSFAGHAIHYYYAYRGLPFEPEWSSLAISKLAKRLPMDTVVDGDLSDWSEANALIIDSPSNLIYGKSAWRGPDDLSGQISVGWTDRALHIAANVRDDHLVQFEQGEKLWEGDHIELWLHAPALNRIYQFGFTPGNFVCMKPHSWIWYPKDLDAPARATLMDKLSVDAVKSSGQSYIIECAIPAELFGIQQFEAGMEIQMSCEVGDADSVESPHETLLSISPSLSKFNPASYALIKLIGN